MKDDPEYKGYFRLLFIMYGILFMFAFINYLPKLGVIGPWIPIVVSIGPIILGAWYVAFITYVVKNR